MIFSFLQSADWLQFFNQYENLFMLLLTLIYMMTSLFFVLSAHRANLTAEAALKELQRQRREGSRPYIHFNIQMDPNRYAFFSLTNSGRSIAREIQLKFHTPLLSYENWKDLEEKAQEKRKKIQPQMTHTLHFLSPESHFVEHVGLFPLFYHAMDQQRVSGEISYYDSEGHCYVETFELNLEAIGKGYVLSKATHFASEGDLLAKFFDGTLNPTISSAIRVCEELQRKQRS